MYQKSNKIWQIKAIKLTKYYKDVHILSLNVNNV